MQIRGISVLFNAKLYGVMNVLNIFTQRVELMTSNRIYLLNEGEDCNIGTSNMREWIDKLLNPTGFILLVCTQGKAIVSVNLNKQVMNKGDIAFLYWDAALVVNKTSDDTSVFYCAVSSGLVDDASYKVPKEFYNFIFEYPLCSTTERQYQLIKYWIEQLIYIANECHSEFRHCLLQNSIQNLFLLAYNEFTKCTTPRKQIYRRSRSWVIVTKFSALLLENCHRERSVNFYANKLCISPYYLYKTTFDANQLSPKEVIDQQVVMELKNYLSNTAMSINEIAEEFNFDDPSYMCRYFQKRVGLSLREYRKKSQI